jgi:hypothetical protein
MIPTELLLLIYEYCDFSTRIQLNRVFGWSYRAANPMIGVELNRYRLYRRNCIKRPLVIPMRSH